MIYILFFLPYIYLFLYKFIWDISFILFGISLLPVFLYTIWNINILNAKIFNDKSITLFIRIYLLMGFAWLFLSMFIWTFYDKIVLGWFLYVMASLIYLDRVYLIYYYFYRKLFSFIIKRLISSFKFVYIKLITASIPILLFLFSIYLFENKSFFQIDNLYIKEILGIIWDNFFANFYHLFFQKLLYISIFIVIILFLIRYLSRIFGFINKVIFNASTFLVFTFWTTLWIIIFQHEWITTGINLWMILSVSVFSFMFIYLFLIGFRQFFWINWEWKNSIYKKLYNKIHWKHLKIGFISIIKKIKNDTYFNAFINDLGVFLDNYIKLNSRNKDYLVLNNDAPITLWDKDLFWIGRFTESIFQIIDWYSFNQNYKGSFSIGLVGEWWWWKTSVVNLLKEEFLDGYPWYKVYDFNPWNYEKKDLIEKFFIDLGLVIWNKKVSKLLNRYLSSLWELHKWFKFLWKVFWNSNIDKIKYELNNELNDLNNTKIIIVIDDLDRCEPDEILIMLNIIKNLWSLTNVIYLVSYDKDNIIKILKQKWFSSTYLDKIINFERFLPLNNQDVLTDYFFKEFSNIINTIFEKKEKIKQSVEPFIKNMEKINILLKPMQERIAKIWESIESMTGLWKLLWKLNEDNKEKIIDSIDEPKGVTKYEDINKEELLSYLQWELSYLFKNSNLRLLKKLLNHLNIVFITNMYSVWELRKVFKFSKEDYLNIIIINYIKIIDYKWFLEVMHFYNKKLWGLDGDDFEWNYNMDELPTIFKEQFYEVGNILKLSFLLKLFTITESGDNRNRIVTVEKNSFSDNLRIVLEKFN